MTISEKILQLLEERKMTQKEFAKRTGISQSTISEWKKKHTNPVSDKILIICEVLEVTPEELLTGAQAVGNRSRKPERVIVDMDSEEGEVLSCYHRFNEEQRKRLLGYMQALSDMGSR